MEAKAVLVLYQPGFKLKNNKYLLSLGPNIVGSDPKCQVIINSKQYFPQQYPANFYLTQDFMYIQALCDNMVQIKSNMQFQSSGRKKDIYKYIEKNCRYIVPTQQIFYIGPYKAIVQVQSQQQLKKIKNILNLENFQTPKDDEQIYERHNNILSIQHKIQINNQNNFDAKSDHTQKIPSQNNDFQYQATLVIQDNDPFVYQPTLLIDQRQQSYSKNHKQNHNIYVLSPNRSHHQPSSQQSNTKSMMKQINKQSQFSDVSMFSKQRQKRKQGFSQEVLYETIKKQQEQLKRQIQKHSNKGNQNDQEDVSMPDTIQENFQLKIQPNQQLNNEDESLQMPNTLLQDQMPPTIQDDQQLADHSHNTIKAAKSMFQKNSSNNLKTKNNLYRSQKIKKQDQLQQRDDILDFFCKHQVKKVQSNQIEVMEKKEIKKRPLIDYDIKSYRNQMVLPHVNMQEFNQINKSNNNASLNGASRNSTNMLDKKEMSKDKSEQAKPNAFNDQNQFKGSGNGNSARKRLFKQSQKLKLVNISGFKPLPQHKLTLRKRGYQIVPQAKIEQYDILIIGKNYKATPKLLLAILLNKNIVSQDWLSDKNWQSQQNNRVQGTIEGISWQIIQKNKGKANVFQNTGIYYLTQSINDYHKVFQSAGGTLTSQLNKRKKTNFIIDCQSDKDKEFYQMNKSCKNWKFYSHKLIGQSILIGQPQFKKYIVDDTNF